MTLEQMIRGLQSRIAKRANQIASLEDMRANYKYFGLGLLYKACRDEIKPLAIEQKLDKDILNNLCNQRTAFGWASQS